MPVLIAKNGQQILVDEVDYEKAKKYKWYVYDKSRTDYHPVTKVNGRQLSFSRLVFDIEPNEAIHHKNYDPLDYRRENIIICNRNMLGHIIGSPKDKKNKYFNVYLVSPNKWCVAIAKDYHVNHHGLFSDEQDAAIVADYFSIIYYGQYAKRNFPEMSVSQIQESYKAILDKYGHTRKEKVSRSHQGLARQHKKPKTSRFAGVAWVTRNKVWAASIHHMGNSYSIGKFKIEEDAAKAYDKKAIELFGENARRNFPELSYDELKEHLDNLYKIIGTTGSERMSRNRQGRKTRPINSSSKFVGIHMGIRNKWISKICYNGSPIHIGEFSNEEDAAIAYDIKALELYGVYAKRNFPDLSYQELQQHLDNLYKKIGTSTREKMSITRQGRKPSNSSSKYVGVNISKSNTWISKITYNKKPIYLGCFKNEEDAARAYDKKALELYGVNAKLNFPIEHLED